MVGVVSPFSQHRSGIPQAGEQRLIQTFFGQAGVEAFDEPVLLWFAWRGIMPLYLPVFSPAQNRHACEFLSVIADHHSRLGQAFKHRHIQLTSDPCPRDRRVGNEPDALARKIIDHGKDAEPSTTSHGIG